VVREGDLRVEDELNRARKARASGNEGQARVCARRAAGIAVRAWYRRRSEAEGPGDALKQLQRLQGDAAVPEAVREAARRLTARVDFDHRLPFEEDPIQDAQRIVEFVSR
jgi:HEPN domain-containing protein